MAPRRLTFEDEPARPSLALDGLSKAIPCIGLRGLVAPLYPSSESLNGELSVGELNLRLLTVGVRALSEQVHGTDIQQFMDVETRELRYPPLQLPNLQQLPVYQQRSAESDQASSDSLPRPLSGPGSHGHFEPLFSRDEHGDPLAVDSVSLAGEASSLLSLDWHPRLPRIAVALTNDSVYIYDLKTRGWNNLMLCQMLQKNIVEVKFDPLAGNTLAVLGTHGLCLWSLVDAGKAAWMRNLRPKDWSFPMQPPKQQPDHVHQQQLAFSPCGRFVVFCNASERSLAVYDLFQGSEGYTSVYTRQHSIASVCWSPNALYVVAACSTKPRCLVWDTATWTLSTWTLPMAPAQQLGFHRSESLLLLSERQRSSISTVRLCPVESETSLDVGPDDAHDPLGGLGGNVALMAWSPTCERLAISFDDDEPGCELIVLLGTSTRRGEMTKFAPIGYIRGPASTVSGQPNRPLRMSFRPEFDAGALLCVAWTQGQLTFYPLIFPHADVA